MRPLGIRIGSLLLLFAGFILSATAGAAVGATPAPAKVDVTVDAAAPPRSTFMGLGIEFDPYQTQPSPARWRTILKRVAAIHSGFFRVMLPASDYCLGFDAKGSPIYIWNHPDPAKHQQFDNLLAVLDFAQAQHIDVYLGEWSAPHQLGIASPADPRWTRIAADFVHYLVRHKHYTVIRHYILMNEPNGFWSWRDRAPDYEVWAAAVRRLRAALDARGLQSVALAGPDNSGDYSWFTSSVNDLAPQFGSWEFHIYARDAEILNDGIESELNQGKAVILTRDPNGAGKQRFIAESGLQDGKIEALDQQPRVCTFPYGVLMADYVAQVARAGWMGADAWDLDDAMHGNGHGGLKIWGFWDSSSGSDMAPRPWFYSWALMSRFLPKGAQILVVKTTPGISRFRATAARWKTSAGSHAGVLLVNDANVPRAVTVRASGMGIRAAYEYRYFDRDRPVNAAGMPRPARVMQSADWTAGITVEMPGRGVVVLTNASF